MESNMGELILVVRADELRQHFDFQGFLPLTHEQVEELYNSIEIIKMDRDRAEEDPTFKQLVAYSAVRSGDNYLTYLRGKGLGEARLHGNRSIGIGGHINFDDKPTLFGDHRLTVAAHREVDEEINIPEEYKLYLAGLLNDDSNAVGQVHLGLVYVAELKKPEINKRERGIARISFERPQELRSKRDEFETWSQILIDNIDKL